MKRARTSVSISGLLAVVAGTLAALGAATPALADHGESRTVVHVADTAGSLIDTSTYGQTIHLFAIVSDISFSCLSALNSCDPPSGTVSFYYGNDIPIGTAGHDFITRRDSQFRLDHCCLPAGTHTILAVYNAQADGGGNHFSPSVDTTTHTVQKASPLVQLHQSSATTVLGQPVTFTASVNPVSAAAASPTGTVQFSDNGSPLGGPVPLAGGTAVLTTSSLAPGSHTVRAQYSGDANHASVGAQVVHAVRSPATSVSLGSSPNPSTVGQAVLLQAVVSAADGVTPTGTVTFKDGGATLGTVALSGGVAQLSTSALSAGSHTLTAVYSGDSTHTASTSPALTHTVVRVATATALGTNPNPSLPGQPVTLQAQVTTGSGTPSGTVTFFDGSTVLGTSAVAGGAATLTVATLAVGAHPITAAYSGDTTHAPSTSTVVTQTVNCHPTTTGLTANVNPSVPNQPVTFRAVITTTGTPTGTVTFKDGATTIGSAPVVGGGATFTTSALGAGTHAITAVYGGDATHAPSTSAALTQTVRACTITAPSTGGMTLGTSGNDVICGSAAADDLAGLGGDDLIVGLGGNDRLMGGDGNDTLWGGEGNDQLAGAGGSDRLIGDGGSDAADGGDGTDTCSAEARVKCED